MATSQPNRACLQSHTGKAREDWQGERCYIPGGHDAKGDLKATAKLASTQVSDTTRYGRMVLYFARAYTSARGASALPAYCDLWRARCGAAAARTRHGRYLLSPRQWKPCSPRAAGSRDQGRRPRIYCDEHEDRFRVPRSEIPSSIQQRRKAGFYRALRNACLGNRPKYDLLPA